MTKADFLQWLNQFRHVGNIRTVVEQRVWGEDELDRLKKSLEDGGRLAMKTRAEAKERTLKWF